MSRPLKVSSACSILPLLRTASQVAVFPAVVLAAKDGNARARSPAGGGERHPIRSGSRSHHLLGLNGERLCEFSPLVA